MKKLYAVRDKDGLFMGAVDSYGISLYEKDLHKHIVYEKYVHALDVVDSAWEEEDDCTKRAKDIVEVRETLKDTANPIWLAQDYEIVGVVAEISKARANAEVIRDFYRDRIHGKYTWALKMMVPDGDYPYYDSDEFWTPHNKEKAYKKLKYHKGNIFKP